MSRISCVGVGAQVTSVTSPLSVTPPNGVQAGDLMVMLIGATPSGTAGTNDTVTITGWTQRGTTSRQEIGTIDVSVQLWYKVAVAGEASVSVAVGTAIATALAGFSCQIAAFRGVDQVTPWDATSVNSGGAAAATFTPTGITTATNNAVAISAVCTADDNALGFSTSQSFALLMSGANYDTTTGNDHAVGLACKEITAAGAVTVPTWSETAVGNDAWAGISGALRPDATTWTLEETWMGLNAAVWPAGTWTTDISAGGAEDLNTAQGRQALGTLGSYGDNIDAYTSDVAFPDDFDLRVDAVFGSLNLETYTDIYFREDGSGNGYKLDMGSGNGFVYLNIDYEAAFSTTVIAGVTFPATLATGDVVHFRVRNVGQSIRIRTWLNNVAEPTTWDFDNTDGRYLTGRLRLQYVGGAAAAASTNFWRALQVSSVTAVSEPTPLPAGRRRAFRSLLTR